MKRKLLALTALILALALLCGCSSVNAGELMKQLFPAKDESVASQQTGDISSISNEPEGTAVVTETYTTADLVSAGCSTGIKSLARYCNQYPTADLAAKDLAQSLIRLEDRLVVQMREYL